MPFMVALLLLYSAAVVAGEPEPPGDLLVADFTCTPESGPEPLTVSFSDLSTAPGDILTWLWDFGDGSTSSERNPVHEYVADGSYDVSLTVYAAGGEHSTMTKSDLVVVMDADPSADFWATPLSGQHPLKVSFTDLSTSYDGITSWAWTFGDGDTSTERYPEHRYVHSGSYTVTLTVTEEDAGSDTRVRTAYVVVTDRNADSSPGADSAPHDGPGNSEGVLLRSELPAATPTTVQTRDGRIAIRFPGGALKTQGSVTVWEVPQDVRRTYPAGYKAAGMNFQVDLSADLSSDARLVVTIHYTDAELAACGGDPERLVLSRLDETTAEWVILPTIVDKETRTLTAYADHFSQWAMLAKDAPPISLFVLAGIGTGGLLLVTGVCLVLRHRRSC